MIFDRVPTERWQLIAAIATIVVLAFVFLVAPFGRLQQNDGNNAQNTSYYPGGSGCKPDIINSLPVGERAEKASDCEEAREQHRLNTNDLVQQTRAANAAEWMATVSTKQTWILIVGLVFSFIALLAAAFAAVFAKEAADIARRAMVADQRPWVPFPKVKLASGLSYDSEGAAIFTLAVSARNIGKTPATHATISLHAIANEMRNGESATDTVDRIVSDARRAIVSNGSVVFPNGKFMRRKELVRIERGPINAVAGSDRRFQPRIAVIIQYRGQGGLGPVHVTGCLVGVLRNTTPYLDPLHVGVAYGESELHAFVHPHTRIAD